MKFITPLLLVILLLFNNKHAAAQCRVSAFATPAYNTCTDSVELLAVSSSLLYLEDFNSGVPLGWTLTQQATFNNPCSPNGVDGTTHIWMGNQSPVPRTIETLEIDLTSVPNITSTAICFDMLFAIQGDDAPCEGPDEPDEGVALQYSVDSGNTWVTIHYFDPNGGNDPDLTNWKQWCFVLPQAAISSSTKLRWFQDADSGADYDHWGIDNVSYGGVDTTGYYYWPHDGSTTATPPAVRPTSDTYYTVIYSDGIDTCSADVFVASTYIDSLALDTILGEALICNTLNSLVFFEYSVKNYPGVNYVWKLSSGGSFEIILPPPFPLPPVLVDSFGSSVRTIYWADTGVHTITVVATSECGLTDSVSLEVKVGPDLLDSFVITSQSSSACSDTLILTAGSGYNSYTWSTGANTQSIIVTQNGNYSVSATSSSGCPMVNAQYLVDLDTSFVTPPEICVVTVDSSNNNYNLVVWEKPSVNTLGTQSYVILKDIGNNSQFTPIGEVPFSAFSTFLDTLAPPVGGERYRLALRDSCGDVTEGGSVHQTMRLYGSGIIGDTIVVAWQGYFGNLGGFGAFVNLYRGTNPNDLSLLATFPADSGGIYFDTTSPFGVNTYYQLELELLIPCVPTARSNLFGSSRSNILEIPALVGVNPNDLTGPQVFVYPNPASGWFNVHAELTDDIDMTVELYNTMGNLILIDQLKQREKVSKINTSQLSSGIYFIKISTEGQQVVKKLVIEN